MTYSIFPKQQLSCEFTVTLCGIIACWLFRLCNYHVTKHVNIRKCSLMLAYRGFMTGSTYQIAVTERGDRCSTRAHGKIHCCRITLGRYLHVIYDKVAFNLVACRPEQCIMFFSISVLLYRFCTTKYAPKTLFF
jgi:hypothetical protein